MTDLVLEPCRDDEQLRIYINEFWSPDHILARDPAMFDFQYRTPWVDRSAFPHGTSVICLYSPDGQIHGFLGAIVAPYPRPSSYWLALWHVLPDVKGTGLGGRLVQAMEEALPTTDDWIGTHGIGSFGKDTLGADSQSLPVFLRRGFAVRAVRRWVYAPSADAVERPPEPVNVAEISPNEEWLTFRYDEHPLFDYDRRAHGIYRTETNEWGVVTHVLRLGPGWQAETNEVYLASADEAARNGRPHLMDMWSFECPGSGWTLAPKDLPSLFHPPSPRGNLMYGAGRPFLPGDITKGDGDQDRPN